MKNLIMGENLLDFDWRKFNGGELSYSLLEDASRVRFDGDVTRSQGLPGLGSVDDCRTGCLCLCYKK